ncbi:MAG TPA: glycosyl hydrolase family 8, partial [Polyangia bacterium]|nr:glycosyl hydrolase family 8 [Polyangia bacterium]
MGFWSLGCASAPASGTGSGGGTGSGTGGTGNTIVMNPPSSYPQNAGSSAAFPFPQGHALPNCSFPTYDTDTVETAYTNWKARFFDGTKIVRPENGNDTVSEGIGYGMLIGVFMNDQPMFDTLWTYAKSKFDGNHLMTWCQGTGQSGSCNSSGSATDGDEDMAYALLMASKQWSGGTYASDAATLIGNIFAHEVSGNILLPGDSFGPSGLNELDPSYFAPSYYRAFAKVDPSHDWMDVLKECYTILAAASQPDGLVPNWVTQSGTATYRPGNSNIDPYFGYDACRTPFRIGMDYCINGEPDAQAYANLISAFYASKATAVSLSGINDGYTTTGGTPPYMTYSAGMAFLGPAGVGAMAAGQTMLRDLAYKTVDAETTSNAMKASGVFTYYHASWGVLSLMAMAGNFWALT